MAVAHFHDNSFEKLDIILYSLGTLFLYVEVFEEEGMQSWL